MNLITVNVPMMQVGLFIHSYMNLCDRFSWLWKCSTELAVCISISVDKHRGLFKPSALPHKPGLYLDVYAW